MGDPVNSSKATVANYTNSLITPYNFHDSITREVIMIDEKSLNLVIRDFIEKQSSLKDILNYGGIFLAITTTLVTAEFKDFLVDASTWQALFMLSDLLIAIKIAKSGYAYWNQKIKTVDDLVEKIKKDSLVHSQASISSSNY